MDERVGRHRCARDDHWQRVAGPPLLRAAHLREPAAAANARRVQTMGPGLEQWHWCSGKRPCASTTLGSRKGL